MLEKIYFLYFNPLNIHKFLLNTKKLYILILLLIDNATIKKNLNSYYKTSLQNRLTPGRVIGFKIFIHLWSDYSCAIGSSQYVVHNNVDYYFIDIYLPYSLIQAYSCPYSRYLL